MDVRSMLVDVNDAAKGHNVVGMLAIMVDSEGHILSMQLGEIDAEKTLSILEDRHILGGT